MKEGITNSLGGLWGEVEAERSRILYLLLLLFLLFFFFSLYPELRPGDCVLLAFLASKKNFFPELTLKYSLLRILMFEQSCGSNFIPRVSPKPYILLMQPWQTKTLSSWPWQTPPSPKLLWLAICFLLIRAFPDREISFRFCTLWKAFKNIYFLCFSRDF